MRKKNLKLKEVSFLLQLVLKRTWNLTWYFQRSDYSAVKALPRKRTQILSYRLFLHLIGRGVGVVYKVADLKLHKWRLRLGGGFESVKGSFVDITALSRGQMGDKSPLATSLIIEMVQPWGLTEGLRGFWSANRMVKGKAF